MSQRVRVNALYRYTPVFFDSIHPPYAAERIPGMTPRLKPGDVVRVKNQPGAPPANTMGQCYIADPHTGAFLGMCMTNSLHPLSAPELRAFRRQEVATTA